MKNKDKIIEIIKNSSSIDFSYGINSYSISETKIEKIAEDIEKLFISKDNLVKMHPDYYLRMCELQRWLREVYSIVVDVYQDSKNKQYTGLWKVDISEVGNYKEEEYPNPEIKNISFEIALEKGLQEALKLIPDNIDQSESTTMKTDINLPQKYKNHFRALLKRSIQDEEDLKLDSDTLNIRFDAQI